jgi:hypothetical protein
MGADSRGILARALPRHAASRLGLLAGGILAGLFFGEAALRAFGAFAPASFHLQPPRARVRDVQTGWDLTYQTNSVGWRDDEYTPAKPAGVTRIAAIGDSFTFGQGCERGEIFPDRLETLLRETGEDVQVLNLSTPGLGPEGYFVLLQDAALRYAPDVVVLSVCGNDASRTRPTPWLNEAVRRLSHRLRVFVLLREIRVRIASPRPDPWTGAEERAGPPPGLAEFLRKYGRVRTNLVAACLTDPAEVARWIDVPAQGEGWREFQRYIGAMAGLCRDRGCRFVIAIVPDGAQVDPQQVEVRRLLGVPLAPDVLTGEGGFQTLVHDFAHRQGIECFDPLPEFRRVRSGLYFPTDLHWTPAGHRLYAEALARYLAPAASGEGATEAAHPIIPPRTHPRE